MAVGHPAPTAEAGRGVMHAARLERSPRLQRVHALLSDGAERSTLEIVSDAQVCAVNSVVAELRENGVYIECRRVRDPASGAPLWLYRMPFVGLHAR